MFINILLIASVLNLSIPAFAAETHSADTEVSKASGHLVISDPSTGEQWNWELPTSDVLMSRSLDASNLGQSAEVNVEIGEYSLRTMTPPVDTERVLHDNITLTVGLRYSVNAANNSVAIYRAYGSAPNHGMYYAMNKAFYYANPFGFGRKVKYPTSTSWS